MALHITDLTPGFASRVQGLDPKKPVSEEAAAELRDLLARRKLLLIREGELSPDQQVQFLSAFGPVIVEAPSGEKWCRVSNLENSYVGSTDKLVFHADYQFTPYGPLEVISLYAEVMEKGEPTVFVDMVSAVDRLPAALRARMETLKVVQLLDYSKNFSEARRSRLSSRLPGAPDGQYPHCTQPMLETHPKTGKRYVNVSQMQTSHVEGWTDAESDALFEEIEKYVYVPEGTYRHIWSEGDLVIWDNKALQHGREALAQQARRSLRRVTVNAIDVPTMMKDARPDPERFPSIQWSHDTAA